MYPRVAPIVPGPEGILLTDWRKVAARRSVHPPAARAKKAVWSGLAGARSDVEERAKFRVGQLLKEAGPRRHFPRRFPPIGVATEPDDVRRLGKLPGLPMLRGHDPGSAADSLDAPPAPRVVGYPAHRIS